jgi:hypothetical protein
VSCEGKERFTTFSFAERVAKLQARRHKGGPRLQAYRCECGAYHVGSTVGGDRRLRSGMRVLAPA